MITSNLYALVDKTQNTFLSPIQELLENWNNVHGLSFLSESKISDLEWAGYPGQGWIKFDSDDILNYTHDPIWFDISKNNIKGLVSKQRWEKENEILTFEGNEIKLDDKTKISLQNIKLSLTKSKTVSWKFRNGFSTLTYSQFTNLYNFTFDYVSQCFGEEMRICDLISSTTTLEELKSVDLTANWPSTEYST